MKGNRLKNFFKTSKIIGKSAQSMIDVNLLLTPISSRAIVAVLKYLTIQVRSNLL